MSADPSRERTSERALRALGEGVKIAVSELRVNWLRSGLTILGVAVGVSVVVTFAALITGVRSSVMTAFEAAGPENFTVTRLDLTAVRIAEGGGLDWWDNPKLTPEEAERIEAQPGIAEALYNFSFEATLSFEGVELDEVIAQGNSEGWTAYTIGRFEAGRDFTAVEVRRGAPVVVLSSALAEEIFGARDPVGKRIRIGSSRRRIRESFEVVGVFEPEENVFSSVLPYWAVLPHTTAIKRLKAWDEQAQILVVPEDSVTQAQARDQVIGVLRSTRGSRPADDNDFAMIASSQLVGLFDQLTAVFFLVMLALSSAGLIVGGVGVIGIMLISVTERTREIGVRKAVGATRREILWQFLTESAFLTVLGGAAGLALGAAFAGVVARLTPIPARIPIWSIGAALTMALVTGVLFGLLPAYRASRMEPVVALSNE